MPSDGSEVWDVYRDEMLGARQARSRPELRRRRHERRSTSRDDVEQGWDAACAPFALHEMNAYGEWMASARHRPRSAATSPPTTPRRCSATGQYRVLTPDDLVAEDPREAASTGFTLFHPLMGGVPPVMGWESLHLFEHEVLPRLAEG